MGAAVLATEDRAFRTDTVPTFGVLIVCTANLCRSPLAQFLLDARVRELGLPWQVTSAGTHARPGMPVHRRVREVLQTRGIDPSGFSSRLVTADVLAQQDLVLAATDGQRARLVELLPQIAPRTFTLRPFGHLVSAVPSDAGTPPDEVGTELLRRAAVARGRVQPMLDERSIPDPVAKGPATFRALAREFEQWAQALLPGVRG